MHQQGTVPPHPVEHILAWITAGGMWCGALMAAEVGVWDEAGPNTVYFTIAHLFSPQCSLLFTKQ